MTSRDWAALLFCALLIGLAVAGAPGPRRRRHSALSSLCAVVTLRRRHSAPSLAAIGCPSLGIITRILLPLLWLPVKVTMSAAARRAKGHPPLPAGDRAGGRGPQPGLAQGAAGAELPPALALPHHASAPPRGRLPRVWGFPAHPHPTKVWRFLVKLPKRRPESSERIMRASSHVPSLNNFLTCS